MFGLVVRFDLKDATAAKAFDELVAETGKKIASDEPGTLLYVVNTVEDVPLARVLYEVYADRDAFDAHENMSHVVRFLAEREQYITSLRVEFLTPVGGKNLPT
ncbi:MAG: antibiotic biosynthesis monooxygenase [Pseudonocardiales bacterium]|nr:antibiotic biosynthesis monooxygenase [Pseudonocardiales bacterium]